MAVPKFCASKIIRMNSDWYNNPNSANHPMNRPRDTLATPGGQPRSWTNQGWPAGPASAPGGDDRAAQEQKAKDAEIAELRAQLAEQKRRAADLEKYAPVDPTIADPPKEECFVPQDWTLDKMLQRFEHKNPALLMKILYARPILVCTADNIGQCLRILMASTRIGLFNTYDTGRRHGDPTIIPWGFDMLEIESDTTIQGMLPMFEKFAGPFAVINMTLSRYRELQNWIN